MSTRGLSSLCWAAFLVFLTCDASWEQATQKASTTLEAQALLSSFVSARSSQIAKAPDSQPVSGCLEASMRGFKSFLFDEPVQHPPEVVKDLDARAARACKSAPVSLSSFPRVFVDRLVALPEVQMFKKLMDQKPHFKVAFLEQQELLALSDPNEFISEEETSSDVVNTRRVLPFWVKGDPSFSGGSCYTAHLASYAVAWLFVGSFVGNFILDVVSGHWPEFHSQLGKAAVISQATYAMFVLICGFAEEARLQMNSGAACLLHKRYMFNFALTLLLGIFQQIASAEARHLSSPENARASLELDEQEALLNNSEALLDEEAKKKAPLDEADGGEGPKEEIVDEEEAEKQGEKNADGPVVASLKSERDVIRTMIAKKRVARREAVGVILLNSPFAIPLLFAFLASAVAFGTIC